MSSLLSVAQAQDSGDDFFEDEDEDYSEPYDSGPEGNERFNPPPQDQNSIGRVPNLPSAPGSQSQSQRNSNSDMGDDTVQFKLVDPPKYWQPKKRKFRKKPSTQI